ncbi:MAG: hypothetical protein ACJ780_02855 [Solirubrobacteraceae bacterium]
MQDVVDTHDTPFKELLVEPLAGGGLWTVQVEPFQTSASGTWPMGSVGALPTATQAVADAHETPFRVPTVGLGVP